MPEIKQTQCYDYIAVCFSHDGRILACFPILTIDEYNKWANENPMLISRLYMACGFDITSKFYATQTSIVMR